LSSCSIDQKEQEKKIAHIDSLVNKYIELDKFNGSVLVVKNHNIIYERVYGITNPVININTATPDTISWD
jgi:hypothetical protein